MTSRERHEDPTTISLPYGKGSITFTVTEEYQVIRPRPVECEPPEAVISDAISNSIGSVGLEEFVRSTTSLLIIVNDGTRPSHTPMILRHIQPIIRDHHDAHFLIATGTHPPPDGNGLARIFGDLLPEIRVRMSAHDATDKGQLESIGTTTRGIEVTLNRRITGSDGIICIGNVKPHYFAGFTGGRKSLIPGCAGYHTIEMNHRLAIDVGARPMGVKENPLAMDLEEGVRLLGEKRIFSIQTVVSPDHRLAGVYCGDLHASFREAVMRSTEVYRVPVGSTGNIVVTSNPYPMDINLYQSQHALENVIDIVEKGGIVILVSKCWDGIGNPAYLDLLDRGGDQEGVDRIVRGGYRLGDHKAVRFLRMAEHADMWAVADLDDPIIRRSRMKPYHNLQQAVDDAITTIRGRGREPRIVVFPFGGMTVPWLDGI